MSRTVWKVFLLGMVVACMISVGFAVLENAPKIEEFYKEGIDAYQDAERLEKIFPEGAKIEYELAIQLFEKSSGALENPITDDAIYKMGQSYDKLLQFAKADDEKIELMKKAEKQYLRIIEDLPISPFSGKAASRVNAIKKAIREMQKQ